MNELIEKITAPNGGVFTGNGTNTYLLGKEDLTLIDPGPKNDEHIDEIIQLGGGKINRILVTHTHKDHSPAALPISKILDVPMYGRLVDGESEWEDETFVPDKVLNHGDLIETKEYSIEVVHTPGHASNHLCFYLIEQKCLLTGDHIMDGATVVIAPPDGKMRDYLESLELLKASYTKTFKKIGGFLRHASGRGRPPGVRNLPEDHHRQDSFKSLKVS